MKHKILTLSIIFLMILSITSCKQKPANKEYDTPLSQTENVEDTSVLENQQQLEQKPQAREHFPVEDIIYELEKIVDPKTDPGAKLLYDAHGGGTVVIDHNNTYSIINYDFSAADYTDTTYKPDIYSEASRATVDHWEKYRNLKEDITVKGTPTGRTIQRVSYHILEDNLVLSFNGSTYVEFLVTEAYYGTTKPGDYIWVCESFAIGQKDGKMQIIDSNECSGYIFLGMDYLITGYNLQKNYYEVSTAFKALRLDVEYVPTSETNDGFDYSVYKKYIIDKDIKLNKNQEYERFSYLNYRMYYDETYQKHQGAPDFEYTDPQFAPTEEQKKIVDEQLLYYGEK